MEKPEAEQEETNWSEAVEDLVESGDTEAAISLLESTISKLEKIQQSQPTKESLNLQLASALTNLANLYSSNGFSLKSDHLLSRSFQIRDAAANIAKKDSKDTSKDTARNSSSTDVKSFGNDKLPQDGSSDDDWEAMADRDPDELLSSQGLPEVSKLSLEDTGVKVQDPKRRGRGTFSYKKNELYSDWQDDKSIVEDAEVDDDSCLSSESKTELRHSNYGTRHVLVLADFSPSTRTTDLEKLFEDFRDRGVSIRWINDTTALAVFRTPAIGLDNLCMIISILNVLFLQPMFFVCGYDANAKEERHQINPNSLQRQDLRIRPIKEVVHKGTLVGLGGGCWAFYLCRALEARNHIQFPFTVRILDGDDFILASVSPRDLEPPRQRPQTSARTAQRLIAQSMGLKLPTTFGSKELKNQEEARRNRIQTRQKLRDDAWGPDDVN